VQEKLTITIDETVYEGLYRHVGAGRTSRFVEGLVRPHLTGEGPDAEYRRMAADEEREAAALEWAEGLIGDAGGDTG
jgi:hypothetical protein